MPMTAQEQAPLPGTRPEGAQDEREAAARVRDMFTRIVPRYDFLNHLLSFSMDHVWRRRTAKRFRPILRRPDARVLDLCCGTGDLAFALAAEREAGGASAAGETQAQPTRVIGSDFVEAMLERASEKARRNKHAAIFVAADALHLPLADASFDLVTTAFGFRNLANYEHGLREIARVLRKGGEAGILEFTEPRAGPMAALFRLYFRQILPRIGGAISGNSGAYAYLPGSVAKFPSPEEITALMEKTGFKNVCIASWNFGSVILYSARLA
jgi:demethylmenaquinone methyltransferase/2-methoxy-6-polyprenyl-1,4-benzoquinol methylase